MSLRSKLRELITLRREQPEYTDSPDWQPDLSGPAGPEMQAMGTDSMDFSTPMPNPDGPYRQIGTKRVSTPPNSFGQRLRAALPDIISSGITAAAHQNTAGGGPADIFGALKDVQQDKEKRQLLALNQRRQAQNDAESSALKRAQAAYNIAHAADLPVEAGIKQQNANTGTGGLTERITNNAGQRSNAETGNAIRAATGGYQIIPPMPGQAGGHPSIRPRDTNDLSVQQGATLGKTGAETENAQARTDQVGAPKPITNEFEAYMQRFGGDAEKATKAYNAEMAQRALASRPPSTSGATARSDKSFQFNVGELNKIGKPVEDISQRLGRLQDTLAQNSPQADALIGPELLTVMAGGQGSGLRMNEAEIARIIGGRSNWETLKASINKWQADPTKARSITPAQQQQIRSLVTTVGDKIQAKQKILNDAHQALLASEDPAEHRKIVAAARQAFSEGGHPAVTAGSDVIRVRQKITGKVGSMPRVNFDPDKYEEVK